MMSKNSVRVLFSHKFVVSLELRVALDWVKFGLRTLATAEINVSTNIAQ